MVPELVGCGSEDPKPVDTEKHLKLGRFNGEQPDDDYDDYDDYDDDEDEDEDEDENDDEDISYPEVVSEWKKIFPISVEAGQLREKPSLETDIA
ncbi:hypothetical protein M0802_010873 [Mischocyttarus mexicanus]|nr:hypothetical protein M0802_010873 [Mischocyttarus mexicanus]